MTDVQNLLRSYNDNVNRIAELHTRSLNNIGDQSVQQQIEDTVTETRQMANQLKGRIKALQSQGGDSRDGQTRRQQVRVLERVSSWWLSRIGTDLVAMRRLDF